MTCRACARPACDCPDPAYAGVIPVSRANTPDARTPADRPPLSAGDSFTRRAPGDRQDRHGAPNSFINRQG